MKFLEWLNDLIQEAEFSIVNLISTVAPWLAPLAPAYMSFNHMIGPLGFPLWVSFSLACVVEMLGLSTISTSLMFWNHNRKYSVEKNKVPVWIPVLSFLFYLTIVLTVNVLMDVNPEADVLAKLFLTLMTIPAAVTLAVRAMHKDILQKLRKPGKKTSHDLPEISGNLPEPAFTDWRLVPHEDRMKISSMSTKQVVEGYGVTERTARNWRKDALVYAHNYVYNQE